MGSFVAVQPNGRLCRFSSVVDCVTEYNMTAEDYIELCAERARDEARDVLKNWLQPYDKVIDKFVPNNMTQAEFNKIRKEMESPVTDDTVMVET